MKLRISRGEEVLSDVEVVEGEYVIGNGASAQVRIESEFIAPEHARLRVGTGGVEVEDLGSGRETWIGELALLGVMPLPTGSVLQVGDVALQVYDDESPAVFAGTGEATGRYVVGAVVNGGAMGDIYSAREVHIGREVAMKQMKPGIKDSTQIARFVREAKITAHLEHPNVVPVHDVNPGTDGSRFYTMKMVRGVSLEKLLELLSLGTEATVAKYPLDTLLTIFQKVCDAVAFAHSKGIIHRDLKPANIMVGAFGEVLVMDWGLAKLMADGMIELSSSPNDALAGTHGGATLAGTVMGTPYYMPPEQAAGDVGYMDQRSDVYSLGAILYELLVLQRPIEGMGAGEVLQNVRAGKLIPPLARLGAKRLPHLPEGKIPASLAAVAMKALSFSPERRYQHVTELQADLRAYQSGFATGAEGAGAWRQFTLFVRRNRGVATAIAAGLVLLGVVSAIYTVGVVRERDRTKVALAETEVQRKLKEDALAQLRPVVPQFNAQGRQFVADGKPEDGIKYLGFSLAVAPENTDIRLERADLLLANNRAAEAIPEYEQVLVERPNHEHAKAGLARARELTATAGGEKPGPWVELSDNRYLSIWRGGKQDSFPIESWAIEEGVIRNVHGSNDQNLVTRESFRDFELEFECKFGSGGNTGILFGSREFQLVDDIESPNGKVPETSCGALCYFIAPNDRKRLKPVGEYNSGRLIVNGNHVEHWINGEKVLEYELGSRALKSLVASGQFKNLPGYREIDTDVAETPIALQTHGTSSVWFRNVRIRKLNTNLVSAVSADLSQTAALARKPAPPFSGMLPGTIWKAYDSLGDHYYFEFVEGGVLNYESKRGFRPNGKWQRVGSSISIDINDGFAKLTGTLSGHEMRGDANSATAGRWTWYATPR